MRSLNWINSMQVKKILFTNIFFSWSLCLLNMFPSMVFPKHFYLSGFLMYRHHRNSLCVYVRYEYTLVSCCARIVNQNKWPTLLHDRADVTTRYLNSWQCPKTSIYEIFIKPWGVYISPKKVQCLLFALKALINEFMFIILCQVHPQYFEPFHLFWFRIEIGLFF
jgi:hypothetical protein